MNYTEEEFFGNKQNEDLEQEEKQEPKVDVGGTVLVTFVKTIAVLLCSVFYFLATAVCIAPKTSIKIYEFFGANQAVIACYERIYLKSGNLADLYNLVQKSIEAKNHNKTSKYIKELQSKSGYQDFCSEVNKAIIKVSESKYIAYVGDLDSYLVSQNIYALYTSGKKEEAKQIAINDIVNSENVYSFGLSTYVECLLSDSSLELEHRQALFENLFESTIQTESGNKFMEDCINEKRSLADEVNAQVGNTVDAILRVYTCLKIDNLILKYYECVEEESNANAMRLQIEELQERYNELIN